MSADGISEPGVAAPSEEDVMRADVYVLLARLFAEAPSEPLVATIGSLQGDETDFGHALRDLAQSARESGRAGIEDEFNRIFVGLNEAEPPPYASPHLAASLYARPLARLREYLAKLGVEREENVKEPEDHIAFLCEVLAGLILGTFQGRPASIAEQKSFFEAYVQSWMPKFFQELEASKNASFYKHAARVGRKFVEIEQAAFAIG